MSGETLIGIPEVKINGEEQVHPPVQQVEQPVKHECSICLSEITDTSGKMVLGCRHEYHPNCIGKWFQEHPSNQTCPQCRKSVSSLSTIPVIKERSLCNEILNWVGYCSLIGLLISIYLYTFGMAMAASFVLTHNIGFTIISLFIILATMIVTMIKFSIRR